MTKVSTVDVNKLGFRYRPVASDASAKRHDVRRAEARYLDPKPLTVAIRLPSISQRLAMYERAGAARQAFYDNLAEDDFMDDFDDLPEEGITEFEDHPIKAAAAAARAERAEAAKKAAKKTPSSDGDNKPSMAIEGVSPPGEGSPKA